jgi:hypothetical protein
MRPTVDDTPDVPERRLEHLVSTALDVVKKARKHRCSLSGENFYAGKLAALRSDAVNAFREFDTSTVGGATSLAELIELVFSPSTDRKQRTAIGRDLLHQIRTRAPTNTSAAANEPGLFPLSLLAKTKRGYIVTIGKQMNGCYSAGWYDACAVMMRRLLETTIIEAFESKGLATNIKDSRKEDFLQLTELVAIAISEPAWNLSRNAKQALPRLKNIGHVSAHSRRFTAQRADIDKIQYDARIAIEEFLHLAALL